MKRSTVAGLLLIAVFLSSCLAQPVDITNCITRESDGFLMGCWHGVIAPVTFIVSLFTDKVEMFSINNNGGWYNFGFVLGAGILFGGSSRAGRRKRS